MNFKEFKVFWDGSWNEKHGFVVINIWDDVYCGRYWSNYNMVYVPEKFKINYNNIYMTLLPVKNMSEYKRVKEALTDRFESERT